MTDDTIRRTVEAKDVKHGSPHVSDWQPIETFPRDGHKVTVRTADGRIVQAHWACNAIVLAEHAELPLTQWKEPQIHALKASDFTLKRPEIKR